MSHNSAAAKERKAKNLEFFSEALDGFAGEYDIELHKYGAHERHWRLVSPAAVLDVWPTTGSYYIKEVPLGKGFAAEDRTGTLSKDYDELDKFLRLLLLTEAN
jgi:hypothetical protein